MVEGNESTGMNRVGGDSCKEPTEDFILETPRLSMDDVKTSY